VSRLLALAAAGLACLLVFAAVPLALFGGSADSASCEGEIEVGPPGRGVLVGATVFGDRRGYRGDDLTGKPDSYAEMGGYTEQTARLLGGLPYLTALRITVHGRSAIAYKRDFGFGQGTRTLAGRPFAIDLYVALARRLGLGSNWSGLVRVERTSEGDIPSSSVRATDPNCADSEGGGRRLAWPLHPHPITSPFCERRAWEACHPGIDIGAPSGTPIHAAETGRVTRAGWAGGYGNLTCIAHTTLVTTCYGHQARIAVRVGQAVARGQVIGSVGSTGHSTGPHLHFEVRVRAAVVDPIRYLG
jgi:murein DD-endopeptidase MepM/ murein hydrolase activator NlpD